MRRQRRLLRRSPSSRRSKTPIPSPIENTYRPTPQIDLVQGFGYDWRHLRQAEDFNSSIFGPTLAAPYPFGVVNYPLTDSSAPSFQGAAIYRYTDKDEVHFNVSDRDRFPTLFERFSSRFGSSIANPELEPERAINFDLGWSSQFAPRSKVSVDVFYDIIRNYIQQVPVTSLWRRHNPEPECRQR